MINSCVDPQENNPHVVAFKMEISHFLVNLCKDIGFLFVFLTALLKTAILFLSKKIVASKYLKEVQLKISENIFIQKCIISQNCESNFFFKNFVYQQEILKIEELLS